MRLGKSARGLKALWREIKSAYPGAPFFPLAFLLLGLLSLSLAVGRAIASDLEAALSLFVSGASALGVFVLVIGRARKSRALEVLGATLAIANSAAALYTRFGVVGLVAPLALPALGLLRALRPPRPR